MSGIEGEPVHPGLFTQSGLLGGSCSACGRRHFRAAPVCPWCGADDISPVTLSNRGTLWGWTAVTAAPPGYEGPVPYGFGVVDLPEDGLRIVTRLVESDPSLLDVGTPMRFTIVALTPGTVTWAFERTSEEASERTSEGASERALERA